MVLPLLLACGGGGSGRVNILLVVIDTLRADRLGCYGAVGAETDALDRLAGNGVLFDAAFTQAPFTLPSITSILTSLYPYRHQVRNNQTDLDDSFTTIAELFRENGYRTGAVLGSAVLEGGRNLSQGFEFYDDQFPEEMEIYNDDLRKSGAPLGDRAQRRAGDVTDIACEWLEQVGEDPFFLMAHYFDPHSKYDPPPPFKEKFGKRRYEGEVAYTDSEIGRLLESLRSLGLDRNTLVVVIGDHGESMGEHGEPEHGFFVYESTIRIPLIFSLPGKLPRGRRESGLVQAIDIFPTIAEFAGIGTDSPLDGRSLLPLLRGEGWQEIPVYSEAFLGYFGYGWSPTRSIRTRGWKLVEAPRMELYDLAEDPKELVNLYDTRLDVRKRLEVHLEEHRREERNVKPLELSTEGIGEVQRQRLEALGYVTNSKRTARDPLASLPDPKDGVREFGMRQLAKNIGNRARARLQEGNVEEGIELLRKAVAVDPKLKGVRVILGAVLLTIGEYAEAEEIYRRLVEEDSQTVEHLSSLGVALANQGRTGEAIALFEACARRDPNDARYPGLVKAAEDARNRGITLKIDYHYDLGGAPE